MEHILFSKAGVLIIAQRASWCLLQDAHDIEESFVSLGFWETQLSLSKA